MSGQSSYGAAGRKGRRALLALLALMVTTLALPLTGYLYVASAQTTAQQQDNPRSNYWRAVRQGTSGYTTVQGQETNVLVQSSGINWREIRNGPLVTYGAWIMALGLLAVGLFHVVIGPARLDQGRTGRKLLRWTAFERALHWVVAVLFIALAVTGLSLLYGRAVLIPLFGLEGFAAYAAGSKAVHNYLGPVFVAALVVMLAIWVRESVFRKIDWQWLKKGGGYIGGSHAPAGRVNAGEKIWFWLLFVGGLAVAVTGLILNFPNLGFERYAMQISTVLHAAFSILLIALAFGHIYLGTAGNEGTFEGMWTGYVDEAWAKQHHDVWYESIVREGERQGTAPAAEPPPRSPKATPT